MQLLLLVPTLLASMATLARGAPLNDQTFLGSACSGAVPEGAVASFCVPATAVPGATSPVDIAVLGTPDDAEYAGGLRAFPWTHEGMSALRILPSIYDSVPAQPTDGSGAHRSLGPGTAVDAKRSDTVDVWPRWDTRRMNNSHACRVGRGNAPGFFTLRCHLDDDYAVMDGPGGAKDLFIDDDFIARFTPSASDMRVDVFSADGPNLPSHMVDVAIALRTLQIV